MIRRSARILGKVATEGKNTKGIHVSLPNFQWKVQHHAEEQLFYITMGIERATVTYTPLNGVIVLEDTDVPPVFQGKGVGKFLAQGVFEYCIKHNLRMKLNCDFLQKFYKDNEEKYRGHVVE